MTVAKKLKGRSLRAVTKASITYAVLAICASLASQTGGVRLCPIGYYAWRRKLCWRVSKNYASFEQAERDCARDQGTLASIHSSAEMNFVRVLMMSGGARSAYIGLYREGGSREMFTSDGSDADYFDWRSRSLPMMSSKSCTIVSARSGYRWSIAGCDRALRYVCKLTPSLEKLRPSRRRCYVCENAASNDECNAQGMRECMPNQQSCQNEIRVENGRRRISKKCKQSAACENNYLQNPRAAWYPSQCSPSFGRNSVCRCCCAGDLCNSGELPCLEESSCSALTVPLNALISCTNQYRPGSLCTFRCERGYRLVGGATRRCDGAARTWTSRSPVCEKTRCSIRYKSIGNGELRCTNSNFYGSSCTFACNTNYTLKGRRSISCQVNGRWSGRTPTCQLTTCDELSRPANGAVSVGDPPVIGTVRQFACDVGFFLKGKSAVECSDRNRDGSGEWSDPPPACEPITCPEAEVPRNGSSILLTPPLWDAVVTYACDEGHYLSGSDITRCVDRNNDGEGEWSQPAPACEMITCPIVVAPANGFLSKENSIPMFGTRVDLACEEGFFLIGSPTLQCIDRDGDGRGEWDQPLPRCQAIVCPVLDLPADGRLTSSPSSVWGARSTFACDVGYYLRGSDTVACVDENNDGVGEWDKPMPTCSLISCPSLAPPANGTISKGTSGNAYGSAVSAECNEGYYMVGENETSCADSDNDGTGEWSQALPQCERIRCAQSLLPPLNGAITASPENPVYGSVLTFSCDVGYFMIGSSSVRCGDSNGDGRGEWNGDPPTCRLISCLELLPPPNGKFSALQSFEFGSTLTVACSEGYFLTGTPSVSCEDRNNDGNGEWNGTLAVCERIHCPEVWAPRNGEVLKTSLEWGAIVRFKCNEGYFLKGEDAIVCGDSDEDGDGEWLQLPPFCEEITCPQLDPPPNGGFKSSPTYMYGCVALVVCNDGFFLVGNNRLECVDKNRDGLGEWDHPSPKCNQIHCPPLQKPDNGFFVSYPSTTWGAEAEFACSAGYYLVGSSKTQCYDPQNDGVGEWREAAPSCQLITCPAVNKTLHGNFVISSSTLRLGTEVTIQCDDGYYHFENDKAICSGDNSSEFGHWTGAFPRCKQILCEPSVASPEGGEVTCTDANSYGSVCTFACGVGRFLVGSRDTQCLDQDRDGAGQWIRSSPTCQQIVCLPPLEPPINGNVSCSDSNKFGSDCRFSCGTGYFLNDEKCVSCSGGEVDGIGVWNQTSPTCARITCDIRTPPNHGEVTCTDDNFYGSTCSFRCDLGYTHVGVTSTTCGEPTVDSTGRWSENTNPQCQIKTCSPVSKNPTNGTVSCTDENRYSSICSYECVEGYRLIGSAKRSCQADETWTDFEPFCQLLSCKPAPADPVNGLVFCTEGNQFGSVCNYFCDLGFQLKGNQRLTCGTDSNGDGFGEFDRLPGTCQPILCPKIDVKQEGGTVVCGIGLGGGEPNRYGSECALICDDGWRPRGPSRTLCRGAGEWTNKIGSCQRFQCFPPLDAPVNGLKRCSTFNDAVGSTCSFLCYRGWRLAGPSTVTCGRDGLWSGKTPKCVP